MAGTPHSPIKGSVTLSKGAGWFSPQHPLITFFLLGVVGFLIYSNTFHATFQWDDLPNIVGNPEVKDPRNFLKISAPRFVGVLSFAANYSFGELDEFGYHLVNLLIHIGSAFLVYLLVLRLVEASATFYNLGRVTNRWLALCTAFIFLTHPVQTEAVTYVVQRFASLATFFYLLAVFCYLKWRLATYRHNHPQPLIRNRSWYFAAFIATVLAMKTKEISFTLPLMLVLVDLVLVRRSAKRRWTAWIPFLLTLPIIPLSHLPVFHIGDGLPRQAAGMDRLHYLFTEFPVIVTYLRLMVLPIRQNLDYDYPTYNSFLAPQVIGSFLFLSLLLALAVYLVFFRDRSLNLPSSPAFVRSILEPYEFRLLGFGIFWFFLTLSVESSIVPLDDVIFEHRLYLPMTGAVISVLLGLIIPVRMAAARFKKSPADDSHWVLKLSGLSIVILLVVLSYLTHERNLVWQTPYTLWKDVTEKSPQKARAHLNLGVAYYEVKESTGEAIAEYLRALDLDPVHPEAHFNLGRAYDKLGRMDEAAQEYQAALAIRPNYAKARNNLGVIYMKKGFMEEAVRELEAATELDPINPASYNNLANILAELERFEEAVSVYHLALGLEQELPEVHHNLGLVFYRMERYDDAQKEFQAAITLKPDDPDVHFNLGVVFERKEDYLSAAREYEQVIRLNPEDAEALNKLGGIHYHQGNLKEARRAYESSVKIDPRSAAVHYHLGRVFKELGMVEEARREFEETLRIDPGLEGALEATESLGR